ncbi:hypothetical protein BKA22_001448 [Cellulomonas soli]|nr:hypothetical protein [Cellulomonas soli]
MRRQVVEAVHLTNLGRSRGHAPGISTPPNALGAVPDHGGGTCARCVRGVEVVRSLGGTEELQALRSVSVVRTLEPGAQRRWQQGHCASHSRRGRRSRTCGSGRDTSAEVSAPVSVALDDSAGQGAWCDRRPRWSTPFGPPRVALIGMTSPAGRAAWCACVFHVKHVWCSPWAGAGRAGSPGAAPLLCPRARHQVPIVLGARMPFVASEGWLLVEPTVSVTLSGVVTRCRGIGA